MRFSTDAVLLGWLNNTSLPLPMLKERQSITALELFWSITSSAPVPFAVGALITALPETTPRNTGTVPTGTTAPAVCAHAADVHPSAPIAHNTETLQADTVPNDGEPHRPLARRGTERGFRFIVF